MQPWRVRICMIVTMTEEVSEVQVDQSAKSDSFDKNVEIEFERNGERYTFLKWGQQAFNNFRVAGAGTGRRP